MMTRNASARGVTAIAIAPRVIVAGIDPASTTGLVALSVDRLQPHRETSWRWIDGTTIAKSQRETQTRARNAAALYLRAVEQLNGWRVESVAIERPADAMNAWRAQGQAGQRTGTAFALGESYGLLLAAAIAAGCRVHDYAVTSRRANPAKHQTERVGWMPMVRSGARGQLVHVAPREQTLGALHELSIALRQRPYDGVLVAGRAARLDDNILMALGVLRFHLLRQRG